ncbi:cdc42 effector protein 3 [Poecilia latipinna]|uniref:Cdc42 effector protein 3-like n=1 Tax=Poecilia latipinna TaxID=48699 RepID=A0A3B3U0X2_9TELE|nr:PREDICTED: cdc42 effector protein 3-like [Poecilia latipinna]XP_014898036.1 PREDICTED: cdc42 effector protein 3-like [Poecilia latipinna]
MPLKTSLYRNPSSSRWSSRISKRREVLSVEMISLPLGDFRHVSHIGSDGQDDSFGDLSFLKMSHSLLRQSSKSEQNLFLSCKPPPKPPRLNLDGTEGMQSPEWSVDQKRKKCNSLPLLDSEEEDKCENEEVDETRNDFASNQTCRPGCGSVGSDRDQEFTGSCEHIDEFKDEDSGFSFTLDLGPSILEDVLGVMDKLHN